MSLPRTARRQARWRRVAGRPRHGHGDGFPSSSCWFSGFVENTGRGSAGYERREHHPATGALHLLRADHVLDGVVSSLYEHVGEKGFDEFGRRVLIKDDDGA